MKTIISLLILTSFCAAAKCQTIHPDFWCINSIQTNVDSNGHHSMVFDVYNNDHSLDSDYYYIAIEALISGNDTIRPAYFPYGNFSFTNSDTNELYRIDTAISQNLITGLLVRKGIPSCGIMIMEAINVSKTCSDLSPLGIDELQSSGIRVYPNPANTTLHILLAPSDSKSATVHLELQNSLGQVVFKTDINQVSSQHLQIDISQFSKGMYLLSVDHKHTQKIILK